MEWAGERMQELFDARTNAEIAQLSVRATAAEPTVDLQGKHELVVARNVELTATVKDLQRELQEATAKLADAEQREPELRAD